MLATDEQHMVLHPSIVVWSYFDTIFEKKIRLQTSYFSVTQRLWNNWWSRPASAYHQSRLFSNDLSNAEEFFPDIWRDSGLWEIIDGVVCEFDVIGANELDWETIKGWEKENNAHLHVLAKSRPMSPADKLTDEELFCDKIANLWAHASGSSNNTTFFTDSFVEIDRGYFQRTGITDRLGNPLKAWHKIMRAT